MESQLERCGCDYDYELIQDIQGRMILHWNYRNLREIPDEVLNFGEHIEEIYLKRNCLEKLPTNIGNLCNLTNLYLVGNQLAELPEVIGNLKCLKVLDISQNYIRKLPNRIGELAQLESLLITYNQLEEIPKCFQNLRRLKQLEVSGNRIYSIPSTVVDGLQLLEEFGIDRNPISYIPRSICLLRNLRYFSACRCNLLLLPSLPFHSLFQCSQTTSRSSINCNNRNLQFLFDGNPRLNYIPYWVLQLLGSNVECFGCGLDPGESDNAPGPNPFHAQETSAETQLLLYTYRSDVNRPKIKLNFKGKRRTLHFDEDVVKIHHHSGFNGSEEEAESGKATVATLFELCIRTVYQLDLLDKTHQSYCGMKPVDEPLIIPQRVDKSLINIRGQLQRKDESFQKAELPMQVGNCVSNTFSNSSGVVFPSTSSSSSTDNSVNVKTTSFQEKKIDHSSGQNDNTLTKIHNISSISTALFQVSIEENAILPANLYKLLQAGPVAKCFECLKPIFTETWPIVFHIPGWVFDENVRERIRGGGANGNMANIQGDWDDMHDGKLFVGCAHFCSAACVTRFQRGTKFSSNLVLSDLRCILENELQWTGA